MRRRALVLLALSAAMLQAASREGAVRIPFQVAEAGAEEAPVTRDELAVTLNGEAVKPVELLGPSDDLVLLVVVDLAGDLMQAESAKQSIGALIEELPANTVVGLLRAQDGLQVVVDPTADRAAVVDALRGQAVTGKAGLLESVRTVAELGDAIVAKASVRVAVLFVTDSDVRNYREDYTNPVVNWSDSGDVSRRFRDGLVREKISKLDAALAGTETPLFVLHLAYLTDSLNQAYQTGLMTLASTTGGASYFCRSRSEVEEAAGEAFAAIASHYVVTVPLPKKSSKSIAVGLESTGRKLSGRMRISRER